MSNFLKCRFISVVVVVWALDFITKWWAVKNLSNNRIFPVFDDWFRFYLVYNTGGVFGIFQGNPMIFQCLTGFAIVFLLIYFIKTPDKNNLFIWAVSFIMGGAFGNFTDRFFRHGVVDFIDMGLGSKRWPAYNIADSCISIGACLLIIAFYQMEKAIKNSQSQT